MRPHRLTATAKTVPIDPRGSVAVARAGSLHLWLLIGAGVLAAAQIGKAIISVPMIRSDLALGLDLAGLIVATFATLGAIAGIGAGVLVARLGARQSLIGGMAAIALGNIASRSGPISRQRSDALPSPRS
jgi:predicted MFS family arabinose efflux permease